jgi:uncharacterized protein with GYD domain
MPTYVVLYRFTEQGRKNIKDTVKRAQQIERENLQRGFKVTGTWWTQGQYDLVAVVEAPSEEAMMAGLFNIAEAGNVSSETLRAYTQPQMRRMIRARAAPAARRRAPAPRRTTRARARRAQAAAPATRRRATRRRPAAAARRARPAARRRAPARRRTARTRSRR